MNTLLWILGAALFNSLLGLMGIFSFWFNEAGLNRIAKVLVAFSAGVLLGGGFLHLLPEALESLSALHVFGIAIIGFLVFFVLEGYLHWHHCEKCEVHAYTYLMIIGDSIHNFIDGMVLAGTFMANISLGIVASLMIIGHELPQELGVFGVLISGGFKRGRAIFYSLLAQFTCVLGAVSGFFFFRYTGSFTAYLLPFAAGGFLYIAAADLIPKMHKIVEPKEKVALFFWLCAGIVLMAFIKIAFRA